MKKHTQQGFTLIEIVIVLVVIGILAAVLLPRLASVTDSADRAALELVAANISAATAINYARYRQLYNTSASAFTATDADGFNPINNWLVLNAADNLIRIPVLFGKEGSVSGWRDLGLPFNIQGTPVTCGGAWGTATEGQLVTCKFNFATGSSVPAWATEIEVQIMKTGAAPS